MIAKTQAKHWRDTTLDNLIYDRVAADVTDRTAKGYYNLADVTRVNEWITYLLSLYGLSGTVTTKTLGEQADISQMVTNTETIRSGHTWSFTPTTPTSTVWNYIKANSMEKILYDANLWEVNRLKDIKYCGEIIAGEDTL